MNVLNTKNIVMPPVSVGFDSAYNIRASETQDRRRLMDGAWRSMLREYMAIHLNDYAMSKMPCVDASHELYACVIRELTGRYSVGVSVTGDGEAIDNVSFADHATLEKYVTAYNAAALSLRVDDGQIKRDVLPPDFVDAKFNRAGAITAVRTARPVGSGFVVEEWDIGGEAPAYRVLTDGQWTTQDSYPWVYPDTNKPFIPVVIYRAERSAVDFWGAGCNQGLVEANLEDGVSWTVHKYSALNSSSGIPYTIDAEPIGAHVEGGENGGKNNAASSDVILQLKSTNNGSASVGVLQPTFDPQKSVESILRATEARLQTLGMGGIGVQRQGAESGYALTVRKDSIARMRQATEPAFIDADKEYTRKALACAAVFGAEGASKALPAAIEVSYTPSGPDAATQEAERRAKAEEARKQEKHDIENGLATPISILAQRAGITLEEARKVWAAMQMATGAGAESGGGA